jgi:deoxyribonuclease-4
MPIPDTEISPFRKIEVPYIIHATSDNYGLNIGDKEKKDFNLQLINQDIKWADKLNAKYLILHPGFGEFEAAKKFLEKINDKRILIENMPKTGSNDEAMTGYTPEQIQELMGNKFELCLDLNHAIKAAVGLKKDYKKYIKDFLKLKPKMFHIADGTLKSGKDEHLNIGEGEYDFNFLANCVEKSNAKYVTVETPRNNLNSLKEDLENLKKLKSFLSN